MSMFAPQVSIVIPVYNGANFMREAIDSALAQTYSNLEVIVVNDGSRDDGATASIAKSYGDRIRYIEKENGGVATALNEGIRHMQGEYFSWLSHDDTYPADKVEKQVAELARLERRDVVLWGDFALIDESSRIIDVVRVRPVATDAMVYQLLIEQSLHGCTLLVPRVAFEKVGHFRTDLPTTQDYDLWMRMAAVFSFIHMPEIMAHGRQHPGQGSHTIRSHRTEVKDYYHRYLPTLTPEWMSSHFQPDELSERYLALLQNFARKALFGCFMQIALQAMRALPLFPASNRRVFLARAGWIFSYHLLYGTAKRSAPRPLVNFLRTVRNRAKRAFLRMRPSRLDFTRIYRKNLFDGTESRSGGGSSLEQTERLRHEIPKLLKKFGIRSMLDAPCGDFNWMRHVQMDGVKYIGGDIVAELTELNSEKYGTDHRSFIHLDIVNGAIPTVDLIFCRDCLVHLCFDDARKALDNFKRSGSTYLLTTTFVDRDRNEELFGIWRTLNLEKLPFDLPKPILILNEGCTEGDCQYRDKSLGLWRLKDI